MVALRLERGTNFEITNDQYEYLAVILSGRCHIHTSRGEFSNVGYRPDVFRGLPYAMYLPPNTEFEIEPLSETVEIASCWRNTTTEKAVRLICPQDCQTNLQGGGNASYQMTTIIEGGSDHVDKLAAYEIYVPGGNWALYPPQRFAHTQDLNTEQHNVSPENLHFMRYNRPNGYSVHQIFTDDMKTQAITTQENDVLTVNYAYHTLVANPGTATYGLIFVANVDAAKTESIKTYEWVQSTWHTYDNRLPIVDMGMHPTNDS